MVARRYTSEQYAEAVLRHQGDRQRAADELGVSHHAIWSNTRKIQPASADTANPAIVGLQAQIDDLKGQLEAVTTVKRWAAQKPKKRAAPNPKGSKHLFVPDTQIKLGVPLEHLTAAGNYAAEKKPDVIVLAGDWWDFPSLSSYDRGKMAFEGRRYRLDVEAGKAGMEKFLAPIRKAKNYNPRIVFTTGNHEAVLHRQPFDHLQHLLNVRSHDRRDIRCWKSDRCLVGIQPEHVAWASVGINSRRQNPKFLGSRVRDLRPG